MSSFFKILGLWQIFLIHWNLQPLLIQPVEKLRGSHKKKAKKSSRESYEFKIAIAK